MPAGPEPTSNGSPPDLGFQAAVGLYLGITLAGLGAVSGAISGVPSAELLATVPTLVTAGVVVGAVAGRRAHGLPERIGYRPRNRLACALPSLVIVGLTLASLTTPLPTDPRLVPLAVAATVVTAIVALVLGQMARNRYVAAVTADDPVATWEWHWSDRAQHVTTAIALATIATGIGISLHSGVFSGMSLIGYGVVYLLVTHTDLVENRNRWNPPEARVHEAGVVVSGPVWRKLYPWGTIADVRLADDALVLERRRRLDVRCARSGLEDAEAVYRVIERTRAGA